MNARLALPTAATAVALALILPTPGRAYNVFGDTLDLTQRDFRIWNNFTDPEANGNLALDPDYPGATGAALAIWKGVAEWGSSPHGTGRTDPTQAEIGSGASNFDAFFSGYSEGPGNKNANVISMLEGSAFIKAFTNIPIRDGWRIRFYEDPWTWNDDPAGVLQGGADGWDLQGVAAHEYGHALGLDHSNDAIATMAATSSDRGLDFRSIEADDIAGLQFLYGQRAPTKPLITGYTLYPGGQVLIEGRGFHPTKNQVWFTHRKMRTGPDGDPIQIHDVPSIGDNSRILMAVPPGAGPGDIAVRGPSIQFSALSNAYPFDPRRDALEPPISYGSGKLTSAGTLPVLEARTLPSISVGSFTLALEGAVGNVGVLLVSDQRAQNPFQGGLLLVAPPVNRAATMQIFFGQGTVDLALTGGEVGTSRYYQAWFHDPGDPFGAGLSNGVRVTLLH